MTHERPLLTLNDRLDTAALAKAFARKGRLQIRDFLTAESAASIHRLLQRRTDWGISWRGAGRDSETLDGGQLRVMGQNALHEMSGLIDQAMRGGDYAFSYGAHPLTRAEPAQGSPHPQLLGQINSPGFMNFMRTVTGIPELSTADGLASFFGPGQFLSAHNDDNKRHRRVAYVMNFCAVDWRPDWGGYLNFYGDDGNVIDGFRPCFNTLNIFRVPQVHNVTMVAPFAPAERFAITGWFHDG